MDLPALLPDALKHYGASKDEEELLENLKKTPADLIRFFEFVCADETWSKVNHPNFTQNILTWLTEQSHLDRLDLDSTYYIADQIYAHYDNIKSFIPLDLIVTLKDGELTSNSLLFRAGSDYLQGRYRSECVKMNKPKISLEISRSHFELINLFLFSGEDPTLWKYPPDFLFDLLISVRALDLEGLALIIEDVLKRYIERGNVFDLLDRSRKKRWPHLYNACMEFINQMESDVRLVADGLGVFRFEFVVISEDALSVFQLVKDKVTQLVFSGNLTEDPRFLTIVDDCPRLNSLDISGTTRFTDFSLNVFEKLQELVISDCAWLNPGSLLELLSHCKKLQKLHLSSNVALDINSWAILANFPSINFLNLARCPQIRDEEFKVILQAGHGLTDLNITECTGISDRGFGEMARLADGLVIVNLSYTNIGDGALAEVGLYLKRLTSLNLSRCKEVSEKGILELARAAPGLRVLNIAGCNVSKETLAKIRSARPFLTLVK